MSSPLSADPRAAAPGVHVLLLRASPVFNALPPQHREAFEALASDLVAAVPASIGAFEHLVGAVDFPDFVGRLIHGVFRAIVDASIEQMEDYAELVKSVGETVAHFADDALDDDRAREWLVDEFEPLLCWADAERDDPPPHRHLVLWREAPERALAGVSEALAIVPPLTDLDDPAQEHRLVGAALRRLARDRLQLLSGMVVAGIQRIVAQRR